MVRLGMAGLAMAAVATMGNIGLAKAAPRPMGRKELELVDAPMPDLLPAFLLYAVTSTIDTMPEKRRLARLPSVERAIIDAAEDKRLRKHAKRLAHNLPISTYV